jgi:hypothetical protein
MFNNAFKYKSGSDQKGWRIFPSKKVVSALKDKLSALIFDEAKRGNKFGA